MENLNGGGGGGGGGKQYQAIAVLSVESDLVRFSVLSAADGRELVSAAKSLPLIVARAPDRPANRRRAADGHDSSDSDSDGYDDSDCDEERRRLRDGCAPAAGPLRGHVEQDPRLVWAAVEQVIDKGVDDMCRDGTPLTYIKSMGIVNEMGTLLSWDGRTGEPLHNAVHWTDSRMLASRGGTAAAAEWLLKARGAPALPAAVAAEHRRLGTWDAWLLWKLTAGQTYVTDATNASYTRLLDLDTGDWDWDACRARGLTERSWPAVADAGGSVIVLAGRLLGTTVHAVMARPSAALYGQACYRRGQAAVTMTDRASVAVGSCERRPPPATGDGGPWPVIGYREPPTAAAAAGPDGRDRPPRTVYGLLAVTKANSVVRWMTDVGLVASSFEFMNAYNSGRPGGRDRAYMVPALDGLPTAPNDRPDARLVVCGVTERTTREHLIAAAVDAMCHSVSDMLRCVAAAAAAGGGPRRAVAVDTAFVDGKYSRHVSVLQQVANVAGCRVVKNRDDAAAGGVARMAAAAVNAGYRDPHATVIFRPVDTAEQRAADRAKWTKAVLRSYGWARTSAADGSARVDDEPFACRVPSARAKRRWAAAAAASRAIDAGVQWCRAAAHGLRQLVFGDEP